MPSESYPWMVADRLASQLAALGFGVYGDDLPQTSEWVIVVGPEPPASDVTCITVTPSGSLVQRADTVQAVQVKWRGPADDNPWGDVADRAQQVVDWAHPNGRPRSSFTMGDLRFGRVDVTSMIVLGPDTQRRPQAAVNLEFHGRRVARP